jgi:predicted nuclease of predicted toxin-antitoxin system
MKFLLDANMPRSSAIILRRLGHDAVEVRLVLPAGASDASVAAYAKTQALALVTRELRLCRHPQLSPGDYFGLLVLDLPDDATAPQVTNALEAFLRNEDLLGRLPKQLAIVELWRVRFRGTGK